MKTMIVNYALAFTEGFALIVSPCILPVLPLVLSGGLMGGRRRPVGIIIGFTLFFALFSLLSGTLIRFSGINPDVIRNLSWFLIAFFGVVMISDHLSLYFGRLTQRIANKSVGLVSTNQKDGLISGIFFGALVSIIWVPCGGPVLAAAIVHMAVQKTFFNSFILFLFFALGSVLPMIFIVLLGKKIMDKLSFIKLHGYFLRKFFGVVILVAVAIMVFTDPSLATFGKSSVATGQLTGDSIAGGIKPYSAPELNSKSIWFNSPPLGMETLRGKVVLVDFWTYSCINCIRTLPYLKSLYENYHDKGLVIVGVHSPEFEFEKNKENVSRAIAHYKIPYPVVLDNDYTIWQNFANHYWPAQYLINQDGQVVYQHWGEGNEDVTEYNIQVLLKLAKKPATADQKAEGSNAQTPETYLGLARAATYQGTPGMSSKEQVYSFPNDLALNYWALQGKWQVQPQYIKTVAGKTAIRIHFNAKKVYVVMGAGKPVNVRVLLNNKPYFINKTGNQLTVDDYKLYPVLDLPRTSEGQLELQFDQPDVALYTVTFG